MGTLELCETPADGDGRSLSPVSFRTIGHRLLAIRSEEPTPHPRASADSGCAGRSVALRGAVSLPAHIPMG